MSYKLHKKQAEMVDRAINNGSYGIFMDTGTGKTLVALTLIDHYLKLYPQGKVLVLCPLSIIHTAWMDDIEEFKPHLMEEVVNLNAAREDLRKAWKALKKAAKSGKPVRNIFNKRIILVNYESFRVLYPILIEYQKTFKSFEVLILDESSKIKDPSSKVTDLVHKFCPTVEHRFPMSGCPAPNSPLELWSQSYVINPSILGRSYYGFRNRYGTKGGYMGKVWSVDEANADRIINSLAEQAWFVKKEECLDLPEQVDVFRHVTMPKDAWKVYKDLCDQFVAEINGDLILAQNVLSRLMRLRQITSGQVTVVKQDNEDIIATAPFLADEGTVTITKHLHDAKRAELVEVLRELPVGEPVLVWGEFIYELERTKEYLEKKGYSAALIYGATPAEDRREILQNFRDGKVQVLLAHPKTIGHGVTLVNCSYAVYMSCSYSYETEKQSRDRIHRYGQTKKCTYIYLVVPDTIDTHIIKALRTKKNMVDAMMEMLYEA